MDDNEMQENEMQENEMSGDVTAEEDSGSRTTNWLLVAIVVLLLAILASQVLPRSDDDEIAAPVTTTSTPDTTDTSEDPNAAETTTTVAQETTTTSEPSVETTTTTTTTSTTGSSAVEVPLTREAAEGAVSDWIGFLADEDADGAWGLVAIDSQQGFGGRSTFDRQLTDLVEGYGAWADVSNPITFVNSLDSDGPDFALVVTLAGTLSQEGESAWSAVSIPVIMEGGSAKVSPFLGDGNEIGILAQGFGDEIVIPQDAQFTIIFPSSGSLLVFVNGSAVTDTRTETEDGGSYTSFGPLPLEVGNHTVTGIYVDEDGGIHARSRTYVVGESS